MALTEIRNYYKPFEYQWAYDAYRNQQLVHWTKDEIKLGEDLQNWHNDLTKTEKDVIGGILKGFVQTEILVGDYWRTVATWFPKPEIQMMAATFSYFEGIHIDNYAVLNEELGLTNFKDFVQDEDTKAKLDYLINIPPNASLEDIAKSLAIFSAFAEGVLIFSSFAVLLSFQKENLMKGVGQIVSFSIRDENLHSVNGIKLFNTLCEENKSIKEKIKSDIFKAAELVYKLESTFVINLFKSHQLRTITENQLLVFIKQKINTKLNELDYNNLFEFTKIEENLLKEMSWFDALSSGREFGDFFATRVTEYTKRDINPNDLF